jgi:tetratricopeptide (TPR) repeat protein
LSGEQSRLPAAARRDYSFLSPAVSPTGARLAAWDRVLKGDAWVKIGDAVGVFEQLTREDAQDAAAWYNLGLVRARLGENRAALEALDRYVTLESDEARAGDAWALAEVLRCGHGMQDDADYHEYSYFFQIREPQRVLGALNEWEQARRLVGTQVNEQAGILSAVVVEALPTLTVGPGVATANRLAAYLMLSGGMVRIWGPNQAALDRVRHDWQQAVGPGQSEPHARTDRIIFTDVVAEAQLFPIGPMTREDYQRQLLEQAARYFEDTWAHRPLRSLNRTPPMEAAGDPTLRKKLRGAVQFLQDCAALGVLAAYDFDRLRRKLGLTGTAPAAQAGTAAAPANLTGLGVAELAGLKVETLTDEQLEQGYQAAVKLDAKDLASRFAQTLVARPPRPDRPDRFPWYTFLVQRAVAEGDTGKALDYLNEGEKADCEQNEGRRRNDYELRRAQLHAKRGEADQAHDVFTRLIERVPSELGYHGTAAEAMLSLKQGARALRFAEDGLSKARAQNNRDLEQHFLELAAAAKKQGG